jgi:hypothetical protein
LEWPQANFGLIAAVFFMTHLTKLNVRLGSQADIIHFRQASMVSGGKVSKSVA